MQVALSQLTFTHLVSLSFCRLCHLRISWIKLAPWRNRAADVVYLAPTFHDWLGIKLREKTLRSQQAPVTHRLLGGRHTSLSVPTAAAIAAVVVTATYTLKSA